MDNARMATQIHGGYGFANEYPIARHYRDSKILEIGEDHRVQLMLIARSFRSPGVTGERRHAAQAVVRGVRGRHGLRSTGPADRHRSRQRPVHDPDHEYPAYTSTPHSRPPSPIRRSAAGQFDVHPVDHRRPVGGALTPGNALVANLGFSEIAFPAPMFTGDTCTRRPSAPVTRSQESHGPARRRRVGPRRAQSGQHRRRACRPVPRWCSCGQARTDP